MLLDCPVSGTGAQLASKDVVVYASGDPEVVERAAPVLAAFSRGRVDAGAFGAGTKLKLVANLLVAIHNLAAAEALLLAGRAGLDLPAALAALTAGAGTSRMLEVRGPLMISGEFGAAMRMQAFQKDLDIIGAFARQLGCPTPLLAVTAQLNLAALAHGLPSVGGGVCGSVSWRAVDSRGGGFVGACWDGGRMQAARVVQAYRFALARVLHLQVQRAIPDHHARPGLAIGIDLGVRTLLTGVDDAGNVITVAGPNALRSSLRRLRRADRAHSRTAKGSANRRKAAARLARIHARVASIRADALHKATSGLAARYETVVTEDLNVAGMTRNRRLARAIADQGFGTARRMLGYKTTWHAGRLIMADRWFPSSKTCSGCGTVKTKLALSERTYTCAACGLVIDRDINAAYNLLKLAASGAESLNACGGTVRPSPAEHVPVKQEPGTAPAGKTGTAASQPTAASRELTHAH